MKTLLTLLAALTVAACGGDDGTSNPATDAAPGTDATGTTDGSVVVDGPAADAPGDGPDVPTMITVTGRANEVGIGGMTAVANATIAAYRNTDEATAVATTTSDAQGNFTLQVTTNGAPLDGFIKATKANYTTTYLYPSEPLVVDTANVPLLIVTTQTYQLLSSLAQGNQLDTNGLIAVVVLDAPAGTPVAGATISSSPAASPYRYNASGFPNSTATSTSADGVGYMFNAPVGAVTVSAAKTGTTFKSHAVKAFAQALTTTVITP